MSRISHILLVFVCHIYLIHKVTQENSGYDDTRRTILATLALLSGCPVWSKIEEDRCVLAQGGLFIGSSPFCVV